MICHVRPHEGLIVYTDREGRPMSHSGERWGVAIAALAGSALLFVGIYLHPMQADPSDAPAAFAKYAADRV